MDTEQQLYQAVLDAPDDDAPRLAYADWCDSQSESSRKQRARFIRMQIELAAPRADSDIFKLRFHTEELEREHRTEWGGALANIVSVYRFDRGFVELVAMTARGFLDNAEQLFALAPIRHVDLVNAAPDMEELVASPHLRRLRSLSLDQCGLTDADMILLAGSPHLEELRWLSITYNKIGMAGAQALAASPGFPCLTYAVFTGNPVEPNEEHFHDGGMIVESVLPLPGVELEERFGYLRWLHHAATTLADAVPDRFRTGCATEPAV